MSKQLRSDVYEGGLTVNPTAGAGVPATIGSLLPRRGTTELWQKTGAANTAWTLFTGSSTATAVLIWGNDDIGAAADTRFLTPGHANTAVTTDTKQQPMPRAGTLRNLFARHNANVGDGDTVVYTVRVNGVATAITCTLASNAVAQASDIVNTVAIVQGDRVDVTAVKAANITNGNLQVCVSLELA